jgi:ribonuclease HI
MNNEFAETARDGRHYLIATDGACKGNPGTGGWGAIIQLKDSAEVVRQRPIAGQGEVMISTNNQMELTAAIRALDAIAEPLPITIISDSRYVIDGATNLPKWKANSWRNTGGVVANKELWSELDQLLEARPVTWIWQRGHEGHGLNEIAHQLSSNAAEGLYPLGVRSLRKRHPGWFI